MEDEIAHSRVVAIKILTINSIVELESACYWVVLSDGLLIVDYKL